MPSKAKRGRNLAYVDAPPRLRQSQIERPFMAEKTEQKPSFLARLLSRRLT